MPPTAARLIADAVNKALGSAALTIAADKAPTKYVPIGVIPFEVLLGGGIPRGRMVEIFGAPSSLKSYIALCAIREAQLDGGTAALVDTEHTFDPAWATRIGIDTSQLILQQPESGELAMDAVEALVSAKVELVVVDSIAAALPDSERSKRLAGESHQPARLAALMSMGLRKITAMNTDTGILWINQLREQVGVTFGNPEKPPGGRAMSFYASIRVNIRPAGKITVTGKVHDGDDWANSKIQTGQKWKAVTEKNKLDRPFKEVFFTWDLTRGEVDEASYLFAQGIEHGIISNAGAMWSWDQDGKTHKVRGKEAMKLRVREDPELNQLLLASVYSSHGLPAPKTRGRAKSGKGSGTLADTGAAGGGEGSNERTVPPGKRPRVKRSPQT